MSRQVRLKVVATFVIQECINLMQDDSKKLLAFIYAFSLPANMWNQQTYIAKHVVLSDPWHCMLIEAEVGFSYSAQLTLSCHQLPQY